MGELSKDELKRLAEEAASSDIRKKVSAKQYLGTLRRMEKSIERKKVELEQLREAAAGDKGMSYDSVRVQTSGAGDMMARTVSEYVDLEKEISGKIKALVYTRHKIIGQIENLENQDYVSLLSKRYVEYKSFELISVEMGYTYQYVREMHGRALQNFGRTYTNLQNDVVK